MTTFVNSRRGSLVALTFLGLPGETASLSCPVWVCVGRELPISWPLSSSSTGGMVACYLFTEGLVLTRARWCRWLERCCTAWRIIVHSFLPGLCILVGAEFSIFRVQWRTTVRAFMCVCIIILIISSRKTPTECLYLTSTCMCCARTTSRSCVLGLISFMCIFNLSMLLQQG